MESPLRVLIVDDTVTYRKIVSDVLAGCPGVEVVGTAANGRIALQRLDQQAADLLVLDLEMPEMNGQAVLEELRRRKSPAGAIMLSAFTAQGAKATLAALETGAFDFVLKPSGASTEANVEHLRRELWSKLGAYARHRSVRQILYGGNAKPPLLTDLRTLPGEGQGVRVVCSPRQPRHRGCGRSPTEPRRRPKVSCRMGRPSVGRFGGVGRPSPNRGVGRPSPNRPAWPQRPPFHRPVRRRSWPWGFPPAVPRPWPRWCRSCPPICRCRCSSCSTCRRSSPVRWPTI